MVLGELHRAKRTSSGEEEAHLSRSIVLSRFRANAYPNTFLNKMVHNYDRRQTAPQERTKPKCYIKMPYIDEGWKRRILQVVKSSRLVGIVGVYFEGGKPLRQLFRPPVEKLTCLPDCATCAMTSMKKRCYSKGVVYKISCNICGLVYIGETGRTLQSRLTEHIDVKQTLRSTVSRHYKTLHNATVPAFTWSILHSSIHDTRRRTILESMYIRKEASTNLMNETPGHVLNIP